MTHVWLKEKSSKPVQGYNKEHLLSNTSTCIRKFAPWLISVSVVTSWWETGKADNGWNSKDANSISMAIFTILIPFTLRKVGCHVQGRKFNLCFPCVMHLPSSDQETIPPPFWTRQWASRRRQANNVYRMFSTEQRSYLKYSFQLIARGTETSPPCLFVQSVWEKLVILSFSIQVSCCFSS